MNFGHKLGAAAAIGILVASTIAADAQSACPLRDRACRSVENNWRDYDHRPSSPAERAETADLNRQYQDAGPEQDSESPLSAYDDPQTGEASYQAALREYRAALRRYELDMQRYRGRGDWRY